MASTRRDEDRVLSADEKELVAKTRLKALQELETRELSDVISRLRERRDRAKSTASRQRREMRGKAAPAGAKPAADDTGTREKSAVLGEALKRANKEASRRHGKRARSELIENQNKALAMKKTAEPTVPEKPRSRTASKGMKPLPDTDAPPSGALDQEGHRPVLERSRKVR